MLGTEFKSTLEAFVRTIGITSILVIVIAIATDYLNGYELVLFTYIFAIYVNMASIANFWFESKKMQKYNVFAGLISFLFFAIFKACNIF